MTASIGITTGLALQNPLLLYGGALAGVALLLAFIHAAGLLRRIQIKRVHTPRAFEGQHVPVDLEIESNAFFRPSFVVVEDQFPPSGPGKVRHLVERPITRGHKLIVHYSGECTRHRGLYTLGPAVLEARDTLGLLRRTVMAEEFTPLLVYPATIELEGKRLHGRGTQFHVGIETSRRPGQSEEFTGLREYHFGDGSNTIHWRSTARRGIPLVKEFREDLTTEVTLFLDMGRLGLGGLGDQTTIEYSIKAAASLARRAVERGFGVQLFAVGPEIEHIPSGRGARHLLMVLDSLALLKVEGESRFEGALYDHTPHLRRGSTLIVIQSVTTVNIEATRKVLQTLSNRRVHVQFVLVEDRDFVKLYREQEDRHFKAPKTAIIASALSEMGAEVSIIRKSSHPLASLHDGLMSAPTGGSRRGA
jgi:uncharacterized protein (DUF58 family)